MKAAIAAILFLLAPAAQAGPREDVRAIYERFVAAQNARDVPAMRSLLLDRPEFLWVSNGQSFWGRETMLARLTSYQSNAVWRARPDLTHAVVVEVSPTSAFIHLPLALDIGTAAHSFNETRFLVSGLFVKTAQGWKISALFTTIQNPD